MKFKKIFPLIILLISCILAICYFFLKRGSANLSIIEESEKPWTQIPELPQVFQVYTGEINLKEEKNPKITDEYSLRRFFNYKYLDTSDFKFLDSNELASGTCSYRLYCSDFTVPKDREYSVIKSEKREAYGWQLKEIENGLVGFEDNTHYYLYGIPEYYTKKFMDDNTLFSGFATKKTALPNLQPIGGIGTQSYDGSIWYSDGNLIIPPYRFPVDKDTFEIYQKSRDPSKPEKGEEREFYVKGDGRPICRNGGQQYGMCFGSDKNYFYYWTWINNDGEQEYSIVRDEKKPDFKVLSNDEIVGILTYDTGLNLIHHDKDFTLEKSLLYQELEFLIEPFIDFPGVYYYNNRIYLSQRGYGVYSFAIDGATLHYESREKMIAGREYPIDYGILSDKDRYYQLIYHTDGYYYEVQRVKK